MCSCCCAANTWCIAQDHKPIRERELHTHCACICKVSKFFKLLCSKVRRAVVSDVSTLCGRLQIARPYPPTSCRVTWQLPLAETVSSPAEKGRHNMCLSRCVQIRMHACQVDSPHAMPETAGGAASRTLSYVCSHLAREVCRSFEGHVNSSPLLTGVILA